MEKLTLIAPSGADDDFKIPFWAWLWALYGFEPTMETPFLWPMTLDMKRALLARILAAHNDRLGDRADLRLWNEAAITSTLQDKVAHYQLRQVVVQQEQELQPVQLPVQQPEELEQEQGKKRGRPEDPAKRASRGYALMELAHNGGAKPRKQAAYAAYQIDSSIAPIDHTDDHSGGSRVDALVRQRERYAQEVGNAERARLANLPTWDEQFSRRLEQAPEEIKESFGKMFYLWEAVAARIKKDPKARDYHIAKFWEWVTNEIPAHYLNDLFRNLVPVREQKIITGYIVQAKAQAEEAAKPKERDLFPELGSKPAKTFPQK